MKRYLALTLLLLALAACGNEGAISEEVTETSESQDENEVAALEEENEELKRKKLEKENEELRKELEEQDSENQQSRTEDQPNSASEEEEKEDIEEESAEETPPESEQDKQLTGNKADLQFSLDSSEVKSQLLGTTGGNSKGTFEQNVITPGMSQTEVEDKYGPYEFTADGGGASPAYYGNLAVVYEYGAPYGSGDDASDSSINPDYNYVKAVYYYAGVSESQLYAAWGEPDSYDDGSRSTNGLPAYAYEGEDDDGRYYSTGTGIIGTPDGQRVGIIQRTLFDENPYDEEVEGSEGDSEDITADDFIIYEGLISEYLHRLATYYSYDNYDDIYYYLKEGTPAYDKITSNKATEDFDDHSTYDVFLNDVTEQNDGTVLLNATRVYSHASSNGKRISTVNYLMDTETYAIIDFEQISDTAY
ncbi:hypothetical protein [Salinicoccus kekensis]|uniref:Uncharacterized protein n=1 Tax=Salinicoccus kekensis TaxID=714307 RepID=A0A285UKF0_9STAP|nr:hypothetical protein [Salinicoccus kekensis]SOC40721.1 hypothetical protein SAMN05878391_1082 [Salinicoccus kekensis]